MTRISFWRLLLVAAVFAGVALATAAPTAASSSSSQEDDGNVTVTLLHNNDGESKLLPDIEGGFPGIARFATTMLELQGQAPGEVLVAVTSGDNFLASKEFNASLEKGAPFYDTKALDGLYQAMALGNHDFDFGPDVTAEFVGGFDPPVPFLSANLDVSAEPALQALVDDGRIAKSFIHKEAGEEVGIIGAITPRLPNISSPRDAVVDADVAAAVNAEVQALEAEGVNKIILISHLQGLEQDQALVPLLSGVDVVVAGGGDELLKNDGDTCQPDEAAAGPYPTLLADGAGVEIPVVTGPGGYRCIGQLDMTFDADGNLVDWSGKSVGVALDAEEEAFSLNEVIAPIEESIAALEANIIATSEVDLDGQRSAVRTSVTNEGALLADALLDAGNRMAPEFGVGVPSIAIQNGGGIRNDSVIPAGDFSEARTFDIAPFSNFVVVGEVPREAVKDMLESAVSGWPEAEGFFAQPAGFSMTVDSTGDAREVDRDGDCSLIGNEGSRIVDVTLDDGTKIVENGEVVAGGDVPMATIDFLAGGGDCYPLANFEFTPIGMSYQQALADYVVGPLGGTISEAQYGADNISRLTVVDGVDAMTDGDDDPDAMTDGDDPDAMTDGDDDPDAMTDGDDDPDAMTDGDDDLAETGTDAWPIMLAATTVAIAGALIFIEARRNAKLSLAARLSSTRAFIPKGRKRR